MKKLLLPVAVSLLAGLTACRELPATSPANSGGVHVPSADEAMGGQDRQFIAMRDKLLRKNPVADAQAAINRGERYFLCNAGRSATVPGLTPEVYAGVRARCETRCLDGVTDGLFGPNHADYLGVALDYSASWNKTMLPACQ